ncbi:uncharacterized protein FFB14_09286 [Fusarium fujikuroi]|nr:uncharacterized protein FFB14_09286 [Fusarium fujikuroi]
MHKQRRGAVPNQPEIAVSEIVEDIHDSYRVSLAHVSGTSTTAFKGKALLDIDLKQREEPSVRKAGQA